MALLGYILGVGFIIFIFLIILSMMDWYGDGESKGH